MTEIVRTEDILSGEPWLTGHLISVLQVVDMVLEDDHSPEYVADQLGISLTDVHATLSAADFVRGIRRTDRQFTPEPAADELVWLEQWL